MREREYKKKADEPYAFYFLTTVVATLALMSKCSSLISVKLHWFRLHTDTRARFFVCRQDLHTTLNILPSLVEHFMSTQSSYVLLLDYKPIAQPFIKIPAPTNVHQWFPTLVFLPRSASQIFKSTHLEVLTQISLYQKLDSEINLHPGVLRVGNY